MNMKERLLAYLDYKGVKKASFEKMAGLSNGFVDKMGDNTRLSKLEQISNVFQDLNIDWLRTGNGEMIIGNGVQEDTTSLPLIPVDAMAGFLTGTSNSYMEYDCERFVVPVFRGADFLIRVQGDSMEPKYFSGDIIACQRVPLDRLWFQWGKAYVLDTIQGALIKRLEPSDQDGCVGVHSENPKYKPFDLPANEINGVALVKGVIRVE